MFTSYTNLPGGNLEQKHKNIKFDMVGELQPLQSTFKSTEETKKSENVDSRQITAHIFRSFNS